METKSKPYEWRKDQNALSGIAAGVYCVHDEALRHTVDCNICNPKPIDDIHTQAQSRCYRKGRSQASYLVLSSEMDEKILRDLNSKMDKVRQASQERQVCMCEALGYGYGIDKSHGADALVYVLMHTTGTPMPTEQGRKQDEKLEVWKYISILAAFTLLAFIAELLYRGVK